MRAMPKSEEMLKKNLPEVAVVQQICKSFAEATDRKSEPVLPARLSETQIAAKNLAEDVLQSVRDENKSTQPLKLISEARLKLERVQSGKPKWDQAKDQEQAKRELRLIKTLAEELLSRIKP